MKALVTGATGFVGREVVDQIMGLKPLPLREGIAGYLMRDA